MKSPLMLVRVDADARIGAGHAMRCRALAEAWHDAGGRAAFLSHSLTPSLRDGLSGQGWDVASLPHEPGSQADGDSTAAHALDLGAQWIVADSYSFGPPFFQQARVGGTRVLTFDDEGVGDGWEVDLVLRPWKMTSDCSPRALDGPRYALLRREFAAGHGDKREIPEQARKFLITLGGSDPENWTGKILDALAGGPDHPSPLPHGAEVVVIVGAASPHAESLQQRLPALPFATRLERATTEMARWLAWADVAISAGGSTCWEICCLGLPAIVLPLNSNQRPVASGLAAAGAVRAADAPSDLDRIIRELVDDPAARRAMSAAGRRLVDGLGAQRVVLRLKSKLLHWRPACASDAGMIWEWTNDPVVRAASFHQGIIPWEDHCRWFAGQLADSAVRFLVAEIDGIPMAQVRFVLNGSEAVISISLSAAFRGRQFAAAVIFGAVEDYLQSSPAERIMAYIKPGNASSLRAFQRAGFVQDSETVTAEEPAVRCVLRRDENPWK